MIPKHIEDLITFLDSHLVKENFSKIAPSSYIHTNNAEVIFVKVNIENVVIINDGAAGIEGMDILRNIIPEDKDHAKELHEQVLQDILSLL